MAQMDVTIRAFCQEEAEKIVKDLVSNGWKIGDQDDEFETIEEWFKEFGWTWHDFETYEASIRLTIINPLPWNAGQPWENDLMYKTTITTIKKA